MSKIAQLLKWADTHGVSLDHTCIRTEAYSFEQDRKEMSELVGKSELYVDATHIEVQFDHILESAKSYRTLKRAIGNTLEMYGDSGSMLRSPMIALTYNENEKYFFKVIWAGAYQCEPTTKYHCIPVGFQEDQEVNIETVD